MAPDAVVSCNRLHCRLLARVCVVRQRIAVPRGSKAFRSSRRKRGTGSEYPSCYRCPLGAQVRREVGLVRLDVALPAGWGAERIVVPR
jgi:hypothetical protein